MSDKTPLSSTVRKARSSLDPEQAAAAAVLKQSLIPSLERSNTQETSKKLENEHLFSKATIFVSGLEELSVKINVSDEKEENKQNYYNDILQKKILIEKPIFEEKKEVLDLLPNVRTSEEMEWFENSQNGNDFDNLTEFNEKKSDNWENNNYNHWEESKWNEENK